MVNGQLPITNAYLSHITFYISLFRNFAFHRRIRDKQGPGGP